LGFKGAIDGKDDLWATEDIIINFGKIANESRFRVVFETEKMTNDDVLDLITKKKEILQDYKWHEDQLDKVWKHAALDLIHASNAIEGNTLTREEVALLVDNELHVSVSSKHKAKELEATKSSWEGVNYLRTLRSKAEIDLSTILKFHEIIMKRQLPTPFVGKLRTKTEEVPADADLFNFAGKDYIFSGNVAVGGSEDIFATYEEVPILMNEFLEWLKQNQEMSQPLHPVVLGNEAHLRLVGIHPFRDGNGRVSRMLLNMIIQQDGYPLACFSEKTRDFYIGAVHKYQVDGDRKSIDRLWLESVNHALDIYLAAAGKNL